MCSNSKYYTPNDDDSQKKRCSAVICLRPNPDKIKIIEAGKTKRGKTKFIIDPNTSDENLFNPNNYTLYHKHKGMFKFDLKTVSSLVYRIRHF